MNELPPIAELFCQLVRIPSPSGRERAVASFIKDWLGDNRVAAEFDRTGLVNDSNCGNLIATVPGAPRAKHLLFVAHMDTVEAGEPAISPTIELGTIKPATETILGADNKASVAAVMLLCKTANGLPIETRPTIHAAFTSREEAGQMGVSVLALDGLAIDHVFCVDGSEPPGTVTTRALGQKVFDIAITGRSAHAAKSPESGIDAVAAACRIVAALPVGRQEHGGTLNIAAVLAGAVRDQLNTKMLRDVLGEEASSEDVARHALSMTTTNSVADAAVVRGEARAFDDAALAQTLTMVQTTVNDVCATMGAQSVFTIDEPAAVPPYSAREHSGALEVFERAATDLAIPIRRLEGPYSLEANYLGPHYDTLAMSCGGRNAHKKRDPATGASEEITVDELTTLDRLLKRMLEIATET